MKMIGRLPPQNPRRRRLLERGKTPALHLDRRSLTEIAMQGSGLEIDREHGIIKGVAVLGFLSRNRRRYERDAVQNALRLYEGVRVNLDHPEKPNEVRSVRDRFGQLRGLAIDGDRLRGNLHYNPKHEFAPTVEWFAEHDPAAIGLSHNAVGEGKDENGTFVVKKIVELRSVDLVADPATVKSLKETTMDPELDAGANGDGEGYEAHCIRLVTSVMGDKELSSADKLKKIKMALKLMPDGDGEAGDDEENRQDPVHQGEDDYADEDERDDEEFDYHDLEKEDEEDGRCRKMEGLCVRLSKHRDPNVRRLAEGLRRLLGGDRREERRQPKRRSKERAEETLRIYRESDDPKVRKLVERVDKLETAERLTKRRELAEQLCEKARLPEHAITELFLDQLASARDAQAMAKLIEERRQLAGLGRPRSSGAGRRMDLKEFTRQLRGRA